MVITHVTEYPRERCIISFHDGLSPYKLERSFLSLGHMPQVFRFGNLLNVQLILLCLPCGTWSLNAITMHIAQDRCH